MSKIKGYASLMDGIDKIMGKLKQTRDERDIKEFFVCGLYNKVMEQKQSIGNLEPEALRQFELLFETFNAEKKKIKVGNTERDLHVKSALRSLDLYIEGRIKNQFSALKRAKVCKEFFFEEGGYGHLVDGNFYKFLALFISSKQYYIQDCIRVVNHCIVV